MLTPIPLGFVFVIIGLLFLIPTTPWVVRVIQRTRRRSARVDRAFDSMTRRTPMPYRRVLRKTEVKDVHF